MISPSTLVLVCRLFDATAVPPCLGEPSISTAHAGGLLSTGMRYTTHRKAQISAQTTAAVIQISIHDGT